MISRKRMSSYAESVVFPMTNPVENLNQISRTKNNGIYEHIKYRSRILYCATLNRRSEHLEDYSLKCDSCYKKPLRFCTNDKVKCSISHLYRTKLSIKLNNLSKCWEEKW